MLLRVLESGAPCFEPSWINCAAINAVLKKTESTFKKYKFYSEFVLFYQFLVAALEFVGGSILIVEQFLGNKHFYGKEEALLKINSFLDKLLYPKVEKMSFVENFSSFLKEIDKKEQIGFFSWLIINPLSTASSSQQCQSCREWSSLLHTHMGTVRRV